jgi:hypothetical protein
VEPAFRPQLNWQKDLAWEVVPVAPLETGLELQQVQGKSGGPKGPGPLRGQTELGWSWSLRGLRLAEQRLKLGLRESEGGPEQPGKPGRYWPRERFGLQGDDLKLVL